MKRNTPDSEWSTAEKEILDATYSALLKHGYADLSITRIGEELDKSNSSIYHHYDTKTDLLNTLLEFTIDQFMLQIKTQPTNDPAEELNTLLTDLLPPDASERPQLQVVLVCFRSQAVSDEEVRAQFTQIDQRLAATIQEIIRRGISQGVFREVDASQVTEHLLAMITGVAHNSLTTDRDDAASLARASVASYIESELKQSG
ncbi:transcription regulator [Halorubrum coriense DSM 10284]|uniref:Transcription regulator n=1 Tax=Halorubrum coriense DSM 10284 TaxID=1227466 RepID=M0EV67_9EURY|nr:TetR/AcrR family transcriptional regulator [Halorubrum coriense]ELZ50797.1 transcription regulator [Halorubrum coriense DSM 10284]